MQNQKRHILDLLLTESEVLYGNFVRLKFTHETPLPSMLPGQFVQVRIDHSPSTYLRRPISINWVDPVKNELWLLVQKVGAGTQTLGDLAPGARVNMILPMGNSFSLPEKGSNPLLIGGGVGVAPLLLMGKLLNDNGIPATFLLGARTAGALLELDEFRKLGRVFVTTEDGTEGEKGFVTQHSILEQERFDRVMTCGPKVMMQAVARMAANKQMVCEVSLENTMACGIGACLCCVEDTVDGHVCTCTEGPVFNTKSLKW